MRRAAPLAVAAALALAACSGPGEPIIREVNTAITATAPTTAHSAPASHSPIPGNRFASAGAGVTLISTGKQSSTSVRSLKVGPKVSNPKYDRDTQFGDWVDSDGNNCDTRNDILRRDLTAVKLRAGSKCIVESGSLRDRYTGNVLPFKRGVETSRTVQIDHIVPLADAWRSGAHKWTQAQRVKFANDPTNLIAVEGFINQFKSDKTADAYLPPANACRYAATVITVKTKYSLFVSRAELAALTKACA